MSEIISACGANCNECRFYKNMCEGCFKVTGQPFWTADIFEDKTCPLFKCCVNEKKLIHCGKCSDLPCNLFYEMKDPEMSDEEHKKSVINRVDALNQYKE